MTVPPIAGPRISIELPAGSPAHGGALERVMASATPREGLLDAGVTIDGVPVQRWLRRPPQQVVVSAWCDTRDVPPGLHQITASARWADGATASDTRLLVVSSSQPADWWGIDDADVHPVAVVRVTDPMLDEALARTALGGPPLVLLDEDGMLGSGALARIAAAFADGADVVIGDEASLIAERRWVRWRKRAFQPEALPSIDLAGPLLAVGPRAADILCDALPALDGIYACALELLDAGLQTLAVPHVLALTPQVRVPSDGAPQRRAVERLAARRRRPVAIGDGRVSGLRDVRWPLVAAPEVVAVIPSRSPALTERCLAGVAAHTAYAGLRVVVVDSGDDAAQMTRVVDAAPVAGTVVRYPAAEPFNYQLAVNLGAGQAGDAEVLFLNDDVVPLTDDWLTRMAELLMLPGVGIVGAMLRYPDGRIQHAGVAVSDGPRNRYHDAPGDARGHRFELLVAGNPEAVTGACMLVRRQVLEQLGGHDEGYVQAFGDVDLCYRAIERRWRVAWCAGAELEHHESASYGDAVHEGDSRRFEQRWQPARRAVASTGVRA
jgi:hypothetical protein